MKIISHRGNINKPNPLNENKPEYIEKAISMGFDCEIDLRFENNRFFLGHDTSQYEIELSWLNKYSKFLWVHCKDYESFVKLSSSSNDINFFAHQSDDFALTSKKFVWTDKVVESADHSNTVLVDIENLHLKVAKNYFGICTDYPKEVNVCNSL